MKIRFPLGLVLIFSAGLLGCSTTKHPVGEAPPVVLGQTFFDQQGNHCMLSLVWTDGRHWVDEEPWCGEGEKYSGQFAFRVESGGKTTDTTFASLGNDMPDFFFASDDIQPIYVADYNNDGQPDFNLLSYGGCRWKACDLFTILPSGKIERLKVKAVDDPKIEPGSYLGIPKSFGEISTDQFQLTPTGFFYESGSPWEVGLIFDDWNAKEKVFYERQQIIKLRP